MEDHKFLLDAKGLGSCTRMAFIAHMMALMFVSSLIGYTMFSKSTSEYNFNYIEGMLLDLEAKSNLLYRDTLRSYEYWDKKDDSIKYLNYNDVNLECKHYSTVEAQSNAPIFDKTFMAFQNHFSTRGFFMGNHGYEFVAAADTNVSFLKMGMQEILTRPDYVEVNPEAGSGKVHFCYFVWGIEDKTKDG